MCDVVISKFALLLGGVDAIEDPKTLEEELKSDELLRADIERIIMTIAPYIPFIRILSGGLTTLGAVRAHSNNKKIRRGRSKGIMTRLEFLKNANLGLEMYDIALFSLRISLLSLFSR